jgi:hypothetical protein
VSLTRQLSLFGVEAAAPTPSDLAGLLAAPGQVVRMGGTARVSVVVEHRWRAAVLVAEMRARGLGATCVSTVDEHRVGLVGSSSPADIGVRTAYSVVLAPLANAWLRGAVKAPPEGFALDGRRLRLWMAAAGHLDDQSVTLRMGRAEDPTAELMRRELAIIGLPSEIVRSPGPGGLGPALRVTGRRRLARLTELIGDRPDFVPAECWP